MLTILNSYILYFFKLKNTDHKRPHKQNLRTIIMDSDEIVKYNLTFKNIKTSHIQTS